eukprot:CAMPEP_0197534238 /NCGR_PEP_ID=MMETSP1318-20131121/46429_1 /TAXON_ID=552666 /ORGANISM="Partenskyella glossopodia, Strain RCC365" /LENGTH=89 /DNA_ID=CAMNT_0043091429 /DNA_START=222 /DNA_END=491 /DNA_ORIENTATION=+
MALSQFRRDVGMGLSVRVEGYRYTEWVKFDYKNAKPIRNGDSVVARELYSHINDDGSNFDTFENENVVDDPSLESVVKSLHETIKTQFG